MNSGIGCFLAFLPFAAAFAIGLASNASTEQWVALWIGAFLVLCVGAAIGGEIEKGRRDAQAKAAEHAAEQRARAVAMSNIDNMTGVEFERYLQRLLRTHGYEVELTKASNDLGVDLILAKEGDRIAVQVKRYGTAISRRAISDAVAGMQHYRCSKAMVVTSNYFTRGAKTLAGSTGCTLVDRDLLTQWICEYSGRIERPQDAASQHVRIILCPRCDQQLRIPELYKTLRVRCYTCRHQFLYPSR